MGARIGQRAETFGDGSAGPCQFYSSLHPGAVRRVQASGARAFDDRESRWMRHGKLRPAVVASTLSSQVPVVTDRLLIRPAIRADASAVAATIDEVVVRTNGWTSPMAREQSLAIERGLAPAHRVICELGAGVVGVITTYTFGSTHHRPVPNRVLDRPGRSRQGIRNRSAGGLCPNTSTQPGRRSSKPRPRTPTNPRSASSRRPDSRWSVFMLTPFRTARRSLWCFRHR